jgi:tetratricopeptide (TPR) repeat protein
MTIKNPGMRSVKVGAAFGALLLTAGCASAYDPMYAGAPDNLDGGIGQLMRYCSKFQNSGDLVTAAGLCERAHILEPENPAPLMQLADILIGMNRPERAMAAYRAIIETNPRYTDARYSLGKIHIARGEYDMAAAQFQIALRQKTDDPRLYNAMGVAHGLIGANESAMQAFTAGLKIAPRHISLRNNLGLALVMNGQHEEGVQILEAVAADPAADVTSHDNLQLAYGMVTAAKADAEASAVEQADTGIAQESVVPVEPATIEMKNQTTVAASPAPEPVIRGDIPSSLVLKTESERVIATTGEVETSIEVTSRNDTVSPNQSDASPLRMQTALATTGDAVDADVENVDYENASGPSAFMGAYLTADAAIAAPEMAPKAPESQVAAPQVAAPQVAALQPTAPPMSGGNYVVQLASYRSEARAMLGWSELRVNAPDLLDPISPVVRRADLGEEQGTVYRLRTAPAAKSDATTLCAELKARGLDCLVVKETPNDSQNGPYTG